MLTYTEAFNALDEDGQDRLINHRYDLIKRLRLRIPESQHETINQLFNDAWDHDDPALAFTELGALIDMLNDELDALAVRL